MNAPDGQTSLNDQRGVLRGVALTGVLALVVLLLHYRMGNPADGVPLHALKLIPLPNSAHVLDSPTAVVPTVALVALSWVTVWLTTRSGGVPGRVMGVIAALSVLIAALLDISDNHDYLKWTIFYSGAGLIGLPLMAAHPFEEWVWPRFLLVSAGNVLSFSMFLGLGCWIAPKLAIWGLWFLLPGVLLVLFVGLRWPESLNKHDQPAEDGATRTTLPMNVAKADPILPLAQAALEEVERDDASVFAQKWRQKLQEHRNYILGLRAQPPVRAIDEFGVGDPPLEVKLQIMADLLFGEGRQDATRLALSAGLIDPNHQECEERDFVCTLGHVLRLGPSRAAREAERCGVAVPFSLAQQAELDEVCASRKQRLAAQESHELRSTDHRYAPRLAFDLDLVGLAFSGGGIRSATFNLGVLQALADLRLLHRIDYLSTVSGGGYIGGWLVAWAKRFRGGLPTLQDKLSPQRSPEPNAPSVRPIRFLREYSNYLTPRRGLLGADTWTLVAIWVRNVVLIQAVLVLCLASVLLGPRVLGAVPVSPWPPTVFWSLCALGFQLFLVVCRRTATELKRFNRDRGARDPKTTAEDWAPRLGAGYSRVQWTIVFPGFLCGLLFAVQLWYWTKEDVSVSLMTVGVFAATAVGIGICVIELGAGYVHHYSGPPLSVRFRRAERLAAFAIATLGPAFAGGALAAGIAALFKQWNINHGGQLHAIALGAPLVISILGLALVLHIGLVGRELDDERREWLSRFGAWLLIWSAGWLAAFGLAIYGPLLLIGFGGSFAAASAITWLASTAWGVYASRGSTSTGMVNERGTFFSRWQEAVAIFAPYVFILGFLLAVSLGLHVLLALPSDSKMSTVVSWEEDWKVLEGTKLWSAVTLLAVTLVSVTVLAWRIDVNEFSMHYFYKNRLVRCYLGASRQGPEARRKAHPFTGFDHEDDLPLVALRTDAPRDSGPPNDSVDQASYVGPIPIFNTTLNLVKGDDLAWQERKAQSFVFTPFFSGYEHVPLGERPSTGSRNLTSDGLRPTGHYGRGIYLGTAMAISGAAASPNMGYHSSPASAFLMTMFNVRLGWWMGNPRHNLVWRKSSPIFGLTPLLNELTGNTTNSSKFVNLTDGGHFENLGIYELVRRRCRFIIASDAEQDSDFTFNGLGNAIRKCRMDFGVEIRLRSNRLFDRDEKTKRSGAHAALGEIVYPGGELGWLLYIKSSLTGDEPADLLEYGRRVGAFPHESTADQFFDESQFESYRELGYHIVHRVVGRADGSVDGPRPESWRELFDQLSQRSQYENSDAAVQR